MPINPYRKKEEWKTLAIPIELYMQLTLLKAHDRQPMYEVIAEILNGGKNEKREDTSKDSQ